jgi:glycosyltransferase involved in cell wall biosynthesis
VLNQNYPNLEFIIMDGGSTDNSIEIIRAYEGSFSHWQSVPDGGQANAIAAGFRCATGEILAYLNSDDLYLPHTLKTVATYFSINSEVQWMYGDCLVIDSDNHIIRRMYPPAFDETIFLYENQIVPQQSAFWRRTLYERVGGITGGFQFCMDYDLLMKFVRAGARPGNIGDVLGAFRVHRDAKSSRLQLVQQQEYRTIFQGVTGRSFRYTDRLRRVWCRAKRYLLSPQALLESIRIRLSGAV